RIWGDWVSLGADGNSPWKWQFGFQDGEGFYEFYSLAVDRAGNVEDLLPEADAGCGIDLTPPESSVNPVTPYWQNASMVPFVVNVTAFDATSGVKSVGLYYRYSADNGIWGEWALHGVDEAAPYSWQFSAPDGDGYYEFYSAATDAAGNAEAASTATSGWLAGWQRRRPVTISNGAGQLDGYQVRVEVPRSSDMRQGYEDLRFTMGDGATLLPHWVENRGTASADVWVRVPSVPTGETTVYMYYGNTAAMDASDGNATFEFFDDYSGTSLDTGKWNVRYGSPTVANSVLTLEGSDGKDAIRSKASWGTGYAFRYKDRPRNATESQDAWANANSAWDFSDDSEAVLAFPGNNLMYFRTRTGGSPTTSTGVWTVWDPDWAVFEIQRPGSSAARLFGNDTLIVQNTSNIPTVP
ncbi:MAG: DUF2341 domain-containing protein, partial [Candidatus Zixiibacteriota bacterium]